MIINIFILVKIPFLFKFELQTENLLLFGINELFEKKSFRMNCQSVPTESKVVSCSEKKTSENEIQF